MAFCKFSTQVVYSDKLTLEKTFITDYMPYANGDCVKVYLLGLYFCSLSEDVGNNIESFAEKLHLSEEDIISSFLFWQEQNLVTVINVTPLEVRYLPVVQSKNLTKLFNVNKYAKFNLEIQEILDGRMITPTEFREYYTFMESLNMEASALIMIAKYCANLKGNNVGYPYILTVAKNWAYEGIKLATDVEDKIYEMENATGNVKQILLALGTRRKPDYEDKALYLKWTKQLGYDLEVIILVAKSLSKKSTINKLDIQLIKFKEMQLTSADDITNYLDNKQELNEMAKNVAKTLGLFYENLENIIDTYILKWKQMGYDETTLKLLAQMCFKRNIRTLDGLNDVVTKYYEKGLVNIESVSEFIADTLGTDKKIKEILINVGLSRNVTSWDRDFYRTWSVAWAFSDDVINYVCSLAVGKLQPMNYVNKVLSNYKQNGIKTLQDAKNYNINFVEQNKPADIKNAITHSFKPEELDALFDNLDEVQIK